MKQLAVISVLVLWGLVSFAQNTNPGYDKVLADSLGADQYGMKRYVYVILKTGSNTTTDTAQLTALFRGHMAYINRLAQSGKLVVAGPFLKNDKSYRGLFILNARSVAEAHELLSTDPAIKAKVFEIEVFKWYGSAALPAYLPVHEKIEKQQP